MTNKRLQIGDLILVGPIRHGAQPGQYVEDDPSPYLVLEIDPINTKAFVTVLDSNAQLLCLYLPVSQSLYPNTTAYYWQYFTKQVDEIKQP